MKLKAADPSIARMGKDWGPRNSSVFEGADGAEEKEEISWILSST